MLASSAARHREGAARRRARRRCRSCRAPLAAASRAARCRSGAAIVIATIGMNAIKEISREEQIAVVEPGVILADLHAAVEAEGLFYPPDPNIAQDVRARRQHRRERGGPRAFKYGVTREYVLGLDAILDGRHAPPHRPAHGEGRHRVRRRRRCSSAARARWRSRRSATLRLIAKPPVGHDAARPVPGRARQRARGERPGRRRRRPALPRAARSPPRSTRSARAASASTSARARC